jgi:putative ABC transport system substrate-binding protein
MGGRLQYPNGHPLGECWQRFAKELVALQPDLVVTQGTPATASVLQQTRSIHIVFATVVDPIGSVSVCVGSRSRYGAMGA